jgi:ABC-type transport system involved in cytochrome c biogenesis permease subunit
VNTLTKYFPWVVIAAFTLYAAGKMVPKRETYKEFNLTAFGQLPVLDGGRIKPLDSVARTRMLFISGRSDFEDAQGNTQPAILWLLETLAWGDARSGPAADYRVFRVDNEQLLAELKLEERPGSYRYSWKEILKSGDKLRQVIGAAQQIDENKRELYHSKVIELARRLEKYEEVSQRRSPTLFPKEPGSEKWLSLFEVDEAGAVPFRAAAESRAAAEVDRVLQDTGKDPAMLSPVEAMRREQIIRQLTGEYARQFAVAERKTISPAAAAFGDILSAYQDNKPKGFAEAISTYRAEYLTPLHPSLRDTTRFEAAFNAGSPFIIAAFMYVFAGVFMALSWLGWSTPLRKAAIGLACVALALHFAGLVGRMYLMDRPLVFVTNLYSSALMIGCAAVAGCLVMERLFKNGVGLVVGTTLGAITVKIAHHLTIDGSDTLGNLVAVLDTNFWLASHVTTVTLGYSATYIAGLLGIVYIAWGLFFTTLTKEKHASLGNMLYGVTCFATLLSFVGTVLGGIWADQSWGRFWGWDPKENGAVLIVIWNALILHARWGGLVRQRGMAVLAVIGIMVTTWSWFGTNQLGVGLHNYGFNKTLAEGCMWTWLVSAGIIAIGLIPTRYWRSFAPTGEPRPEPRTPLAPTVAVTAPYGEEAAAAPVQPTNGHAANGHPTSPARGKRTGKKR